MGSVGKAGSVGKKTFGKKEWKKAKKWQR